MANGADIARELPLFLQACAARTFRLGEFDCGLLLADWCRRLLGTDPAAALRGRYTSTEEALALTGDRKLSRLFHRQFRAIGLRLTNEPQLGDLAMIHIEDGGERGAIVTTRGFVTVAQGAGICRVPQGVRRICAWSVRSVHA